MPQPLRESEIIAKSVRTQTLSIDGTPLSGGLLLGTSQVADLNGEADALVLDADADTTISAPTDDQIDIELNSVDHVVLKAVATADAAATTNIVEIAFTSPVDTTGTNVHNALNIDIEIGNATGGTNDVRAIAIDNITGDAQVTETGILLGTGFDIGLDAQGTRIDLDADNDTSIIASTDDTIDIEVSGANDFQITANTFTALAGSTIATDTVAETTTAAGVTVDGVLLKDSTMTGTLIGGQKDTTTVIIGDGAITIAPGTIALTKGSAAAITLAAPTPTTHDGYVLRIYSETAFAHVITSGVDGINAKGSSGTITLGGAKGDSVTLVARNGHWWTLAKVNATVA